MSNNLEHIDSYFQGQLPEAEAQEFERAIAADEELAKEVAFYIGAVAALKESAGASKPVSFTTPEIAAKKSTYRDLYQQFKQNNERPQGFFAGEQLARPVTQSAPVVDIASAAPARRIISMRIVAAAAAVVLIAFFSVLFFNDSPTHQQMADTYITEQLDDVGVSMSSVADSITIGKSLYNDKKYAEALGVFESIVAANPNEVVALEYAGISALRASKYDEALGYFQRLSQVEGMISNPGKFYSAITFMKKGEDAKAKALLEEVVSGNLAHAAEAKVWLDKW